MQVLVTGARGFVGLNVVQRLAQRGAQVWAVDRSPADRWVEKFLDQEFDSINHIVADLSRPGALMNVLASETLDAVVHAAVVTATTEEVEKRDARDIIDSNVGGTVETLQVAAALGAKRFIYVSSPSALGEVGSSDPIDETVVPHPNTLYGITKFASEQIVERWSDLYGLETASIRIAQPYGPGERATAARVRTSPIWEWLRDARPGVQLPTGPLERQRDWTYVTDIAEGIARVAEAEHIPHRLYHLSSGTQVSVGEVFDLLGAYVAGLTYDSDPDEDELNPNIRGQSRPPLDSSRFAGDFGWRPETPLSVGMEHYLRWWSDFREQVSDPHHA